MNANLATGGGHAVFKSIVRSGVSVMAMMAPTPLLAQQAQSVVTSGPIVTQGPETASVVDDNGNDIVVTGSRLRRRDADSLGPLLTITSEDLAKSGTASVGELLQRLPSAGVSLNSNGSQGTSYGVSAINLRYLGGAEGSGNRVLVLVDSRRWVDAVGQRGFRDFVDLNTIPLGMIEGIEILKDGASAIYGADAIAGVVNIKTVQPFDGLRGQARAGATDRGDGSEYQAFLNVGKTWSSGSIILSGSYYNSRPILTGARDLTRTSLVPLTGAGTSPSGLFILPGLAGNPYFGTPGNFGTAGGAITFAGA